MCVNVASDALGVVDDYLLMTRHESEFGGEAYQEGTEKATGLGIFLPNCGDTGYITESRKNPKDTYQD